MSNNKHNFLRIFFHENDQDLCLTLCQAKPMLYFLDTNFLILVFHFKDSALFDGILPLTWMFYRQMPITLRNTDLLILRHNKGQPSS